MKETRSLLLRGAMWIGLTRLLVNLIGFASTIVLARLLLPQDFGLVAIASSAAAIFASLSELSLSQALIQHDDPTDDHFDTAWTMNVIRGVMLAVFIAALGWPIGLIYGDMRLAGVMAGFAIANLAGGFINPRLAMFERRLEFRQWIVLSGGEKLAGFLVSAAIAYIFRSYWALVAGVIASQSAKVVASYVMIRYRPKPKLGQYRDLLSFSIWMTLGQAVQALSWRADPLILGAFMPTRQLGHFSMGSRVANLAVGEVLQPVGQVLFPAFSSLKHEPWRLKAAYRRAQGLMCFLAFPIGFGIASIAAPPIDVLLGSEWREAVPVIQFLAIAAAFQRTSQLNAIAMATGNTKPLFHRDLRALAIRIPLITAGMVIAPRLGANSLTGALCGHLTSSVLNAMLNFNMVARISNVTVREHLAGMWRPMVSAAAMAIGIAALLPILPTAGGLLSLIVVMAAAVGTGAAIYIGMITILWLIAGRPPGAETETGLMIAKAAGALRKKTSSNC